MGLAVKRWYQTTEQTYGPVDNSWQAVTLNNDTGNLVSGVEYIIIANAEIGNSAQQFAGARVTFGGTADADSVAMHLPDTSPHTNFTYRWVIRYTPGSAEALGLEFRTQSGTQTVTCDNVNIIAIPIDHITSGDVNSAVLTTDISMTTGYKDGASLTFTPGTASHDWLILGALQCDVASITTVNHRSQLVWSGGVTSTDAIMRMEARSASQVLMFPFQQVRNLAASSHTVKWQFGLSATGTTGDDHLWSTLIAIDLDAVFEKHAFECNPGDDVLNISSTDYATEVATCTMTPDTASEDVLVLGYGVHDSTAIYTTKARLQQGGTDLNSGVTSAAHGLNEAWAGGSGEEPVALAGMHLSVAAASQTYAMDMSAANDATEDIDDTCIVAISLVEVSTGPVAPTGLTEEAGTDDDNVPLSWTDNATGETGYYAHRGTPGFTPAVGTRLSSDLGAGAEAYTDTSVAANTTYGYVIEVYDGGGSAYSTELQVTTAPARPTLVALNNTDASISDPARQLWIDWSDNTAGAFDHAILYRETAGTPPWSRINIPAAGPTEWVIPLLSDATEYEVTVIAYDGALESGRPTPLTATTGTLTTLAMLARGLTVPFARAQLSLTQAEAIVSTETMLYLDTAYGVDPIVGGAPTVSRLGTKTVLDRKRILLDLIAGYPPIEWLEERTDTLHRRPGMLLEAARTKDLNGKAGEALDTWSLNSTTVTADAVIAPDGTLTADKVVASGTSQPNCRVAPAVPGSDTTYSWSCWVRGGNTDFVALSNYDGAVDSYAVFDVSTKTIDNQSGLVAAGFTGEEADGGWLRVFVVQEILSTDTTNAWKVHVVGTAGTWNLAAVSDFSYWWGGQLEVGEWPTSYIRDSGTAAVSRAVDEYSIEFLWSPQETTFYGAYIDRGSSLYSDSVQVWTIGDYVAGGELRLRTFQGDLLVTHTNISSSVTTGYSTPTITYGDLVEFIVRLDANGAVRLDVAVNGGAFVTGVKTSDLALAAVWGEKVVRFNQDAAGTAALIGGINLLLFKAEPDLFTGQQMRDLVLLPGGEN